MHTHSAHHRIHYHFHYHNQRHAFRVGMEYVLIHPSDPLAATHAHTHSEMNNSNLWMIKL